MGSDALPDGARGVGHRAGDVAGAGEERAEGREARAGEDGEDELALRLRGEGGVEAEELLRLTGHHDGVRAGEKVGRRGRETHAGLLGEIARRDARAAEDGDVRRLAGLGTQEAAHHGAGHPSCSDEGELRHDQRARTAASRTSQALSMSLPSWAVDRNAVS